MTPQQPERNLHVERMLAGAPSCASCRQPAFSAASSCGRRRRHSTLPARPCAALVRASTRVDIEHFTDTRCAWDKLPYPPPRRCLHVSACAHPRRFPSLPPVCRRAMQSTTRALACPGRTRDCLRCNDARADGSLDGDAELLPRDELFELLHQVAAHAVGCIPVHYGRQRLRYLSRPRHRDSPNV